MKKITNETIENFNKVSELIYTCIDNPLTFKEELLKIKEETEDLKSRIKDIIKYFCDDFEKNKMALCKEILFCNGEEFVIERLTRDMPVRGKLQRIKKEEKIKELESLVDDSSDSHLLMFVYAAHIDVKDTFIPEASEILYDYSPVYKEIMKRADEAIMRYR